jgi:tetratricopeptide (TPR) repeat protein
VALGRVAPLLLVAFLAPGAAASEGDPIFEQYRAENVDGLLKPALQKAEALAVEGRVSESNQIVLDAVPEAKRRPVHDFALGNVLYRTRPDLSRALHRKAVEAVPESAMVQLEFAMEEQRAGNCADAVPAYRKVLAAHSQREYLHALLADCLVQLGQYKLAVEHWLKARHPEHHISIEKQIHQIYGKTAPGQRRGEMLEQFRRGQTELAEAIVWQDLDYDQDWWNSRRDEVFLARDLAEIGKVLGVESRRFRELQLWVHAATGKRKLGEGLSELNVLQPPSGAFPVSSFAAYHLIRMALSEKLTDTPFLLKTYEAELRRRALADGANDHLKATEILGFLIYDQRRDELAEIDLAGWKRYQLAPFAASYLIELGKAGRLSLTTPELEAAVKEFPRNVLVQEVALHEARKAGKTGKKLAPYIAQVITGGVHAAHRAAWAAGLLQARAAICRAGEGVLVGFLSMPLLLTYRPCG